MGRHYKSDRTRRNLLNSAFHEIHRSGFQAASLDAILENSGVTKGALYHHFENKKALGYAVVDEVIGKLVMDRWLLPLQETENPIDGFLDMLRMTDFPPELLQNGCPLNNLVQEMSPLDDGFRERLRKILRQWEQGMADALRRGQGKGYVQPDADPDEVAMFLVATLEGYAALVKNSQSVRVLKSCANELARYLETLRATGSAQKAQEIQ